MFQTTFGHPLPLFSGFSFAAIARFLAIHKADSGKDEGAHVPGRSPAFLMVVSEGSADGHVGIESS